MKTIVDNEEKTLLIINSKYHELLYQKLLEQVPFLNNTTLQDINHFTQDLLIRNNLPYDADPVIVKKLKLHLKLVQLKSGLATNANYLDELNQLQDEFRHSNVAMIKDYETLLTSEHYDFDTLTHPYDKIIILDKQDFLPIHHEIIAQLANVVDYSTAEAGWLEKPIDATVWEHANYTKMVDGIIQSIVENQHFNNTVLIIDHPTIKGIIKTYLDQLGLAYSDLTDRHHVINDYLQSLFHYLNHDLRPYDLINIAILFKIKLDPLTRQQLGINYITKDKSDLGQLFTKLDFIVQLDYHDYLQALYNLLIELDIHEISHINELFTNLYVLKAEINKKVLNQLLLRELLLKPELAVHNDIVLADSSFNALQFEHAYIIDAAFTKLKAPTSSTLLNTEERLAINPQLINNLYLNDQFELKLAKISQVGRHIYYHYSLVDFSNKALALKPFIKQQNLPIKTMTQYVHYTIKDKLTSEPYPTVIKVDPDKLLTSLRYQQHLQLSASALDTFNTCQYQYYIKYVLKPQMTPKFDSLWTGNLLHELLETLNNMILENEADYDLLTPELLTKTIDHTFQQLTSQLSQKLLLLENRITLLKKQISQLILRHINKMQLFQANSRYHLVDSEQRLSFTYPNPYLDRVLVNGKIDALFKHNAFCYVLDYKSSYKTFDLKAFTSGKANQLIMYLYLLDKEAYQLTGAFFISLADRYRDHVNYNDEAFITEQEKLAGILLSSDLEAFDKQYASEPQGLLTNLKNDHHELTFKKDKVNERSSLNELFKQLEAICDEMLAQLSEGVFKINPIDEQACRYCEYASLCRGNIFEDNTGEEGNHE